jgi:hypothetical protein
MDCERVTGRRDELCIKLRVELRGLKTHKHLDNSETLRSENGFCPGGTG